MSDWVPHNIWHAVYAARFIDEHPEGPCGVINKAALRYSRVKAGARNIWSAKISLGIRTQTREKPPWCSWGVTVLMDESNPTLERFWVPNCLWQKHAPEYLFRIFRFSALWLTVLNMNIFLWLCLCLFLSLHNLAPVSSFAGGRGRKKKEKKKKKHR